MPSSSSFVSFLVKWLGRLLTPTAIAIDLDVCSTKVLASTARTCVGCFDG